MAAQLPTRSPPRRGAPSAHEIEVTALVREQREEQARVRSEWSMREIDLPEPPAARAPMPLPVWREPAPAQAGDDEPEWQGEPEPDEAYDDEADEAEIIDEADAPSEPEADLDVTQRLEGLNLDQLRRVAEPLGVESAPAEAGDEAADADALRRGIVNWIEESAEDAAEDGGGGAEARTAGRVEAVSVIEAEIARLPVEAAP